MEKIVIRNFGAIQNADIEVKKILILIGEQASGKSTVAKLIYFFKTLSDVFFKELYASEREMFSITEDLKLPMRSRFYDLFGSTFHMPDFEIKYYYNTDRYIRIYLSPERKLMTELSSKFINRELTNEINETKRAVIEVQKKLGRTTNVREQVAMESDKLKMIQRMSDAINKVFETRHSSQLFTVAGREATISYEPAFELYLEKVLNEQMEENRKKGEGDLRPMVDETLMIDYLKAMRKIKEDFRKYGGSFESVIAELSQPSSISENISFKVSKILKGRYYYDQWGEKLQFGDNQYIYLKDASSGQKEVIRILQDILFCLLKGEHTLRLVEEPEAHLFPVAQQHLIELMIMMKNLKRDNQLILTTHSPYVLSVINNLLFAKKVSALDSKIEERIPVEYQIDCKEFAAYSLGNSLIVGSPYCEDILDSETSTIKQNYLDTVSDILGSDYNFLYSAYANALASQS